MAAPLLETAEGTYRPADVDIPGLLTRGISDCVLFAAFDDAQRATLAGELATLVLDDGAVVFEQGEHSDGLYVLLSGRVKLRYRRRDGRYGMAGLIGRGDYFGEVSVLDPGPRAVDAVCLGHTVVARMTHETLERWAAVRPELVLRLLEGTSRQIQSDYDDAADLIFTDVRARLAKRILRLSARLGQEQPNWDIRLDHELTQEELAQLVGSSRETVSKVLADFVRRRWILVEGRSIVVLDQQALARRARLVATGPRQIVRPSAG
jgi:CRP/FNR family transcriptional regulator